MTEASPKLPIWQTISIGIFIFSFLVGWLVCLIAGLLVSHYDPIIGPCLFYGGIAQAVFSLLFFLTWCYQGVKSECGGEQVRSKAEKKKTPVWKKALDVIALFSSLFGWWACLIVGALARHYYDPVIGNYLFIGGIALFVLSYSLWLIYFIYNLIIDLLR